MVIPVVISCTKGAFIIIILTLFITSSPVHAQELTLYKNNPVVLNEPTHYGAVQPFVLREENLFSMWYADSAVAGYRVLRVQSSNGIDWYDKRDTFVTKRQNASDPFVMFEDGTYTLYFASSNFGHISLWESTSTDGITYEDGAEKEILKSEVSWEGSSLSCPAVIKESGIYYLFYAGNGMSDWGIGLATSKDGENWQKCTNNPFIDSGASAQIIKYRDLFYLFFQSPNGLEVQQTNLLNGCDTVWTNRRAFSFSFGDPAPIVVENDLWLYGTFPTETGLHIGLAANATISPPTYPIVLVPGMFASWNKDALLHNTDVPFDTWKLLPPVTEYDAFSQTLENKGRTLDKDYFVFAYDWRKPIEETTQNLNSFLSKNIWSKNPYQPVQIVGHSLGGIVSRIYADKNPTKPIKQIVTAGSPHQGIVQVYKPLAAGEIDRENSLMWLAEKLVLLLNKSGLQSDKDTITQKLPVLFDMFPIFPFLKNESGSYIASTITNSLVAHYPIKSDPSVPQFFLGGSGKQTLSGYTLGPQTPLDTLFGTYGDGHPTAAWTEDGDGTILIKSSLNQITPALNKNHGEIIYSKESIKTILSNLHIQVQDTDIPEGHATALFPAILAFIQSPATIEIEHKEATQKENEGMIWIQNAENGTYKLTVTGTGSGEYTASVWLIGETNDKWIQFKKPATNDSKDVFTISFDIETGGAAQEYVSPTPTSIPPLPTATLTPSPIAASSSSSTSVNSSQSSSSNNNSVENSNNEGVKVNTNATNKNPSLPQLLTDGTPTIPHVLGAMDSKKKPYYFPLIEIFFIKQVLWGIFAVLLILFEEATKIKNGLNKKIV